MLKTLSSIILEKALDPTRQPDDQRRSVSFSPSGRCLDNFDWSPAATAAQLGQWMLRAMEQVPQLGIAQVQVTPRIRVD